MDTRQKRPYPGSLPNTHKKKSSREKCCCFCACRGVWGGGVGASINAGARLDSSDGPYWLCWFDSLIDLSSRMWRLRSGTNLKQLRTNLLPYTQTEEIRKRMKRNCTYLNHRLALLLSLAVASVCVCVCVCVHSCTCALNAWLDLLFLHWCLYLCFSVCLCFVDMYNGHAGLRIFAYYSCIHNGPVDVFFFYTSSRIGNCKTYMLGCICACN